MNQVSENANTVGRMLAAMALIILGGTNVFLNAGLFLRGHAGNWIPTLPWLIVFGVVPVGFGAWLLLRSKNPQQRDG